MGWEAMTSLTGRENSRATTTFCWLPPDREPAWVAIDGVRMSKSLTAASAPSSIAVAVQRAALAVRLAVVRCRGCSSRPPSCAGSARRASGPRGCAPRPGPRSCAASTPSRCSSADNDARPSRRAAGRRWPRRAPSGRCPGRRRGRRSRRPAPRATTSLTAIWKRSSRTLRSFSVRTTSPGLAGRLDDPQLDVAADHEVGQLLARASRWARRCRRRDRGAGP